MPAGFEVPIIIVGFGHSDDIVKCLNAIATQRRCPKFEVFICENGGPAAFDALVKTLTEKGAPCEGGVEPLEPASSEFVRACRLRLAGGQATVAIGEARDNFGYAGGINAWLRPLLAEPDWTAIWILNPDTWPEPDALAELVAYAGKRGKGMVGSRLMIPGRSDIASSRGLKWNKLSARLTGVDIFAPVSPEPDPEDVERRMDSPTGPSMYVTRNCIERIGLMDESFFFIGRKLIGRSAPRPHAASAMPTSPSFPMSWARRPAPLGVAPNDQPFRSISATGISFTSSAAIIRGGFCGPCS